MKKLRIFCAADLHLGRRLSQLPEGLENFRSAPKEAWKSLVQFVCNSINHIDVVVLAGDIFDNEQDLYEALAVFEEGAQKILSLKIPIITIAGNHDAHLLKKCHRRLNSPFFTLLGENETWETKDFVFHDLKLSFTGWSFSKNRAEENPLLHFKTEAKDCISLGILHCDAQGKKESCYAPVNVSDFEKLSPSAWILGHVHIPGIISQSPLVFYCGSLQGLDPSERNAHGAFLLEIDASRSMHCTFIPLGPIFWCTKEVDLTSIFFDDLDDFLCTFLRTELQNIPLAVKKVLCRVVLKGHSTSYRSLDEFAKKIEGRHFTQVGEHEVPCYIETVSIECKPQIDLASLCKGKDLASLLAQNIQAVEMKTEFREKILQECREYLLMRSEKSGYIELKDKHLQDIEKSILKAGYEVLDRILQQEESECAF